MKNVMVVSLFYAFLLVPFSTGKRLFETAVCCWHAAGMLLVGCWHAVGLLLICCWRAAGSAGMLLVYAGNYAAGMLLVCCWFAAGMLLVCYWCAAGMLLVCCWHAAGTLLVCCWYAAVMRNLFIRNCNTILHNIYPVITLILAVGALCWDNLFLEKTTS